MRDSYANECYRLLTCWYLLGITTYNGKDYFIYSLLKMKCCERYTTENLNLGP